MPNGEWLLQLGEEAQGLDDRDLLSLALKYIATIGRGPAFLAWFRAHREDNGNARG